MENFNDIDQKYEIKKSLGPGIGQMIFSNNYLAVLFSGDARP